MVDILVTGDVKVWGLELEYCDSMGRWNGGGGCGVVLGMGIPHTLGYGFRISEVMEMSDWWFWEWVDGFWVTGYGLRKLSVGHWMVTEVVRRTLDGNGSCP